MTSVDEILDFAIAREEDAALFYEELAQQVERTWMKDVFLGFSREEKGHKAKLERIKAGGELVVKGRPVVDLKLSDYTVVGESDGEMDYDQALVVAMQREKAAYRLYSDLAESTDVPRLREAFLALAQEEARHKLRFEVEYDEYVLQQN